MAGLLGADPGELVASRLPAFAAHYAYPLDAIYYLRT